MSLVLVASMSLVASSAQANPVDNLTIPDTTLQDASEFAASPAPAVAEPVLMHAIVTRMVLVAPFDSRTPTII